MHTNNLIEYNTLKINLITVRYYKYLCKTIDLLLTYVMFP